MKDLTPQKKELIASALAIITVFSYCFAIIYLIFKK